MATAHLLCGYNGAGKSTHARALARDLPAVRLSLDAAMRLLHAGLDFRASDYGHAVPAVQDLLWQVAVGVLDAGVDVVLDWNLWSGARRAQWRAAVLDAGHRPVLHHVVTSLEQSIARAAARGVSDPESHTLDEAEIRHLASIFEPPQPEEGLEILRIRS